MIYKIILDDTLQSFDPIEVKSVIPVSKQFEDTYYSYLFHSNSNIVHDQFNIMNALMLHGVYWVHLDPDNDTNHRVYYDFTLLMDLNYPFSGYNKGVANIVKSFLRDNKINDILDVV
jgi:hypothetical protein